uniref:Uncharacterized protein n=1 Tax=Caenorhabditis japonica TaxID=281687 RepID=A0A8R1I7P2_CAEJA
MKCINIILIFVLITITLISSVVGQFFFPFAIGQSPYRYQKVSETGYEYSDENGVKDTEGFFPICSGWSCTSNT